MGNLISSVYGNPTLMPRDKPKLGRDLTARHLRRYERILSERLVALVRANGFPECKRDARLSQMRSYLKARRIKY